MLSHALADKEKVAYLQKALVDFYRREGRRLPWRGVKDPYVVLVSELLLQKTTSSQVLKVFDEFFKRWPSIADLAVADLNAIKEVIGRLGLVKRAEFLKEIALKVMEAYGGEIPRDESLTKLKGVGRYTANAVRCFAFGERAPIVDANVARTLRRYFGLKGGKPAYADKNLWELADAILPKENYVEFNYGLLDLSAKYCRPEPSCVGCPLKIHCSYTKSHLTEVD
jgi:A/G-specific adenine glycosylase